MIEIIYWKNECKLLMDIFKTAKYECNVGELILTVLTFKVEMFFSWIDSSFHWIVPKDVRSARFHHSVDFFIFSFFSLKPVKVILPKLTLMLLAGRKPVHNGHFSLKQRINRKSRDWVKKLFFIKIIKFKLLSNRKGPKH